LGCQCLLCIIVPSLLTIILPHHLHLPVCSV
ncbi:uncharacterized protein METZ01_LOCUS517133, partial [marine metagenome]